MHEDRYRGEHEFPKNGSRLPPVCFQIVLIIKESVLCFCKKKKENERDKKSIMKKLETLCMIDTGTNIFIFMVEAKKFQHFNSPCV